MGHYYGDLACDFCGNRECSCPSVTDGPLDWFVVDGFEVITAQEFLSGHDGHFGARLRLAFKVRYNDRYDAERAAMFECEQAVEKARAELTRLKHICKVVRPWEKK